MPTASVTPLGQGCLHNLSVKSVLFIAPLPWRRHITYRVDRQRKRSIGNCRRSRVAACPRCETVALKYARRLFHLPSIGVERVAVFFTASAGAQSITLRIAMGCTALTASAGATAAPSVYQLIDHFADA